MKLRLVIIPFALALLAILLLPVYAWLSTGHPAWLLIIPTGLVLLLVILLRLALWGAHGGIRAIIDGQSTGGKESLDRVSTVEGTDHSTPRDVQVVVDLERTLAVVSEEYLSFAIDTSQVVGGRWWEPGASRVEWGPGSVRAPVFDFKRPRLVALTKALSPAYLRIGGSEADCVYYDMAGDLDQQAGPPRGYHSILTRSQWDALNAFARECSLRLVFCLNAGPGNRSTEGAWMYDNARDLMRYSASRKYQVDVWEFGNEMNLFFSIHGLGEHVPLGQYVQDLELVRALVEKYSRGSKIAGQGSAFWPILGEPLNFFFGYYPEYVQRVGAKLDLLTWHYYPQQSRRGPFAVRKANPTRMLEPGNLDEASYWAGVINQVRDRYAPGIPVWLGETGNAQFGGEPGVSDSYIGGLWWLDQLGLMAQLGTAVTIRQTLTGGNYGLLDEVDLSPRPDYWNSLAWKRLMGVRVFGVKVNGEDSGRVRVYAHSNGRKEDEGHTILVINLDTQVPARLRLPQFDQAVMEVFLFQAQDVLGPNLLLNGEMVSLDPSGNIPGLVGKSLVYDQKSGFWLPPLSYAFLSVQAF